VFLLVVLTRKVLKKVSRSLKINYIVACRISADSSMTESFKNINNNDNNNNNNNNNNNIFIIGLAAFIKCCDVSHRV